MSFIEFVILGMLALVLVLMWEMQNQVKMILITMNETIKAIKDGKPTSNLQAASAKHVESETASEVSIHWPFDADETDVSSAEDETRLNEMSTSDLTHSQLERKGMYRMRRAWIRDVADRLVSVSQRF